MRGDVTNDYAREREYNDMTRRIREERHMSRVRGDEAARDEDVGRLMARWHVLIYAARVPSHAAPHMVSRRQPRSFAYRRHATRAARAWRGSRCVIGRAARACVGRCAVRMRACMRRAARARCGKKKTWLSFHRPGQPAHARSRHKAESASQVQRCGACGRDYATLCARNMNG